MSTLQLKTDIIMNSMYAMSYLLFKHGTFCNRRINQVTIVTLYRTFFLVLIFGTFMIIHGFTASLPVKRMMVIMFFVIVSPIQIFMYGFTFKDVGYNYLYRIYGEYKRNFTVNLFSRYDILRVLIYSILDTVVFYLMSLSQEFIVLPETGEIFNMDGF
jgi:energy-coupling factor transporter transmembrane protein EcfT